MEKWVKILVEVLIFVSLVGVVATIVAQNNLNATGGTARPTGNITGASLTMYGLLVLFMVVGFIIYLVKTAKAR